MYSIDIKNVDPDLTYFMFKNVQHIVDFKLLYIELNLSQETEDLTSQYSKLAHMCFLSNRHI